MNDSLYYLSLIENQTTVISCSEWSRHFTDHNPALGLFDYGMQTTLYDKLVIFGGFTCSGSSRRYQDLVIHDDLWMLKMNHDNGDFLLVNCSMKIRSNGGFSNLLYLGAETIAVITQTQVIILDFQQYVVYPLVTVPYHSLLEGRSGYGIFGIDSSSFILMGGHLQTNGTVEHLDNINSILILSFDVENSSSKLVYVTVGAGCGFLLFMGIILVVLYFGKRKGGIYYVKERRHTHPNVSLKSEKTIPFNSSSLQFIEPTMVLMNQSIIMQEIQEPGMEDKFEDVQNETFVNHDSTEIYIPGFRLSKFDDDFLLARKLAVGGFGIVFQAVIANDEIARLYNHGNKNCVIKVLIRTKDRSLFFQELSVFELFRNQKNFCKLISYCENPDAIVLKYYQYGSLKSFVFKKRRIVNIPYTLDTIVFFAQEIVTAIDFMHSKGVIHNDIKLDNILLDADEKKNAFPVITDFGIVKILNSADIVQGFKILNCRACTNQYSSPELLDSLRKGKNQERVSNVKTDTYSLGVVLFELFTRKRFWDKFDKDYVISGGLPNISLEPFISMWSSINEECALILLMIVVDCVDYNPERRPALKEVKQFLLQFKNKIYPKIKN